MPASPAIPVDTEISIAQLTADPYPIYRRLRAESPVIKVDAIGRILLTKSADTQYVKDNPELFSSDDPNTPMEKAFQAKTLMRRDGADHMRLRMAMMPAFSGANIKNIWAPLYTRIAKEYVSRLPRGETVDFFKHFAAPLSARCLAHLLGMHEATDTQMERWSQTLIDGAGNFGWRPEPFEKSDIANIEINACLQRAMKRVQAEPDQSALSVQVNAESPIENEHIISNIKIAIGGGLNEPRDSMMTALFGLLTHPAQLSECKSKGNLWTTAFEEAVRWVAPIQVSSRRVIADTVLRGVPIQQGDVVMTSQASANHDEEIYDDGHLYNLFREKARHQSFGNGPHFCMGTHIARRMVGDIVLPLLFDRFPNMELKSPEAVVWSGFGFRGPLNLPITLN